MKATLTTIKPMGLMLGVVVAASSAVVGVTLAASAKADFTLSASPASVSVAQGQVASYSLTEQVNNGFSAGVALSVSGLPAGATAAFSPNPLSKGITTASLAVATSASTPVTAGTTLTITGTSGSVVRTTTVTLVVTAAPAPVAFTISASPSSQSILPGDTTSYTVNATRPTSAGYTGPIDLSVASGLPDNATATFSPAILTGSTLTSTLAIATKSNSPAGHYTITVSGSGSGQIQSASVSLHLTATGKSFAIQLASPVSGLAPRVTKQIDLLLTNTNTQPMQLTALNVALQSVVRSSSAPAALGCSAADFTVGQYVPPATPPTVAAGQTVALSTLVTADALPTVTMNDPAVNQDGCKGATLNFVFTGSGQG